MPKDREKDRQTTYKVREKETDRRQKIEREKRKRERERDVDSSAVVQTGNIINLFKP